MSATLSQMHVNGALSLWITSPWHCRIVNLKQSLQTQSAGRGVRSDPCWDTGLPVSRLDALQLGGAGTPLNKAVMSVC